VDQLLHLADRWTEDEGMTDHQGQAPGCGERRKLLRLLDGCREGLLQQDVFISEQRTLRQLEMRADGSGQVHCINAWILKYVIDASGSARRRMPRCHRLQSIWKIGRAHV